MWSIHPFEGVGPLRFGMTPAEVQDCLGTPTVEFRKGSSTQRTLAFNALGVHAYFDEGDKLDFVETFLPCRVQFGGQALLGSRSRVVDSLREAGFILRDDASGGLWVDSSGFALFAPGEAVEGVSIFPMGYPRHE